MMRVYVIIDMLQGSMPYLLLTSMNFRCMVFFCFIQGQTLLVQILLKIWAGQKFWKQFLQDYKVIIKRWFQFQLNEEEDPTRKEAI